MNNYIFTCGDINGIGPEVVLKTFNQIYSEEKYKLTLLIPKNVFQYYKESIPLEFPYEFCNTLSVNDLSDGKVAVINIGNTNLKIGEVTSEAGKASYLSVIKGFDLIKAHLGSAIITAPIAKKAWELADIKFTGHTELFAHLTGIKNYSMMFLSPRFKAVLVTIHIPIKSVSQMINIAIIKKTILQARNTLEYDLKIKSPRIAVLGLNPHAGENGQLGNEESEIITPAVEELQQQNIKVEGPFVPDAFFGKKLQNQFDVVVGMYHDQVLIPFKLLNFDTGVNYTAGLPIVRTSPDHGTAFDIARKLIASPNSTIEAFNWAREIVKNRNCSLSK